MNRIPESKWIWSGSPGHFICSRWCRFHLTTIIGGVVISSVGDYHPSHAKDTAKPETIGCDRLYEVMVFQVTTKKPKKNACQCTVCCHPMNGTEIDFKGANSAVDAESNHRAMCRKWASKKRQAAIGKEEGC